MKKLPKAVMEAAKRADELLTQGIKGPEGTEVQTPPVDTVPVVVETPPAPAVVEVKKEVVDEAKSREADPKYWEHRFKTLQGISDAERNRAKTELETLRDQVKTLKEQMKDIKSKSGPSFDFSKILSQDELETYTPETLKVLAKIANEAATTAVKESLTEFSETKIEPIVQTAKQSEEAAYNSKVENFWITLEGAVPNWEAINADKNFLAWLSEVDPITGNNRQAYLTAAQNDLKADRVIAIFKAYQGSIKPAQTPVKTIEPEPVQSQPIQRQHVEAVSRSEIKRFQTDVALGRYRTRPTEKEAMDRKIAAAIAAGTVY